MPLDVWDTTEVGTDEVGTDEGGSEVSETEDVTGGGEVMLVVGGGTMPLIMEDWDETGGAEVEIVPDVTVVGGTLLVDGATEAVVMFVVGSCVRDDRMDDRTSVVLAVVLAVVVAVAEDETPVPAPEWLMPLDRATELVVFVLGFRRLLIAESSDERGSTGAEDEAVVPVVFDVFVVADEAGEDDFPVDDAWGNTTMPEELSDSLLEGSDEALDAGVLVVFVVESELLTDGVPLDGGTTMVLVATMTVVTRPSDEDAPRAWELLEDRFLVELWSSVRLMGCELEKMSCVVWRFVVPVLLLTSLSELEAELDRLDSMTDCRLVGATVGGGGAWGLCCVLVALTNVRLT